MTPEQITRSFIEQIDAALARRGMSRASLARRIGKSRSHVSKSLRPNNNTTLDTMSELASGAGFELHIRMIEPDATEPPLLPGDHPEYNLAA